MSDSARLYAQASRNGGVVSIGDCQRAGMTNWEVTAKCRSGEWVRLARGAYLVSMSRPDPPTRADQIRAAIFSYGPDAVVGLQTAAELHGIGGPATTPLIHVFVPGRLGRARRVIDTTIRPHQITLREADITVVSGVRVTTVGRTIVDLVTCIDRFSAVAAADSCLNRGLLTADEFEALPVRLARRRGAVIGRQVLAEADARAESPLETRVRLRAADGKVAPDQLQYVVRGPTGRIVARTDFAWTRRNILGEADGSEPHSTPEALFYDRERQNVLMAMGFRVIRFTWADTLDPETIPRIIRAALGGLG